jgi:methionyl-tRNA formyltransferase
MRVIIITQNEPFYLKENLEYLIKILPNHSEIVGCVVNEVSPFGKKESFFQKSMSKNFHENTLSQINKI